jgi:hypothetical protein
MNAVWLVQSVPQGLKPSNFYGVCGTTKQLDEKLFVLRLLLPCREF